MSGKWEKMSDEAALLAAILAAPDDSAPWLVYADWLDERGRPAAGFIRERLYDLHKLAADMPNRCLPWRGRTGNRTPDRLAVSSDAVVAVPA